METKRTFLNHFYHHRFASGYDQNQLIVTDVSEKKQTPSSAKTDEYCTEVR